MRTYIDSMQAKMDRLLETMLALAQKEKDIEINIKARRVASRFGSMLLKILGVTNLGGIFVHPKGGLIPIHVPGGKCRPP